MDSEHNIYYEVDLLVRSWIERLTVFPIQSVYSVDLLVRSWIERLQSLDLIYLLQIVDLLVRSWIERSRCS